jgi:hypothetical protein
MSYAHLGTDHRYLRVGIKEDSLHFIIQDDQFSEIFFREGRSGIDKLGELIDCLIDIYDALRSVPGFIIQKLHLTEILLSNGKDGVNQLNTFIASLIEIKKTLSFKLGYKFKIGNGQDTVFTIPHNFHTRNVRVVVENNYGYVTSCVAIRVIDENTITVGFSPKDPPGTGDEQYTVELFPNG